MISSDATDGYDVCVIEQNSRKYVCLGYWSAEQHKYRILQCERMPQGLKSAGVWYSCWVYHGFNRCFGAACRAWVLTHVDDALTHANTETRCWGRFRCVVSSQKAMGIIQSPKIPPNCRTLHKHVGLHWMKGQIRASDTVRDTLRMGCAMRPKTVKHRRRCLGLIKASSTCLAFGPKGQIRFGELLDILQKRLKDGWTQETIDVQ